MGSRVDLESSPNLCKRSSISDKTTGFANLIERDLYVTKLNEDLGSLRNMMTIDAQISDPRFSIIGDWKSFSIPGKASVFRAQHGKWS